MRRRLDSMHEREFQTLKEKLDHHIGKLSHTIGFGELSRMISYTDELLYELLMDVLKREGIDIRIKSIIRDIAAPMTVLMDKYRKWPRSQEAEFDCDIQSVSHVMKLSAGVPLNYMFVKGMVLKKKYMRKFKLQCKSFTEEAQASFQKIENEIVKIDTFKWITKLGY